MDKTRIRQSDINNSRMPSKTILRVAPWIFAGLTVGMSRFRSGVVAAVVGRGPLKGSVLDVLRQIAAAQPATGELAIRRTYSLQ